jgi:flagellar basal-body rod protein FlgF
MEYMIKALNAMSRECIRQINRLDCITNNIANVNTSGFKAEKAFFLEEDPDDLYNAERPLESAIRTINYSQGVIQKTGNTLDLAVNGKGFFVVQTDEGEAYTRDGKFTLDTDKNLVTEEGDYVLGTSGKITIPGDNVEIEIDESGAINVDGSEAGVVKIVDFGKPDGLVKQGNGLFRNPDDAAELQMGKNHEIQSGYLELSNVKAVEQMVDMINVNRSFELYQKVMQTLQEQDKLSTNRIGKL